MRSFLILAVICVTGSALFVFTYGFAETNSVIQTFTGSGGSGSAGADAETGVIRYKDENGVPHYVTSADKVPAKFRDSMENPSLPKISVVPHSKEATSTQATSMQGKCDGHAARVEVLVTNWCPYCRALEEYLKKEKIQYHRMDIDRDNAAKRLHKELGGGGIPMTRVNGSKVIRGYQPDVIMSEVRKGC